MATITGDDDNNYLVGTSGDDVIMGLGGADHIEGRGGFDQLDGGDGKDVIDGGTGNDYLYGRAGRDILSGGDGNDGMLGGEDDDFLSGGNGNDNLFGGAGKDTLRGAAGDDVIYGDEDGDLLSGGAGKDTFQYNLFQSESLAKNGRFDPFNGDTIADFQQGQDKIGLSSFAAYNGVRPRWSTSGPKPYGLWTVVSRGWNPHTDILADTSGDGVADFAIRLTGAIHLKASDFLDIQPGHTPVANAQTLATTEEKAISGTVTASDADGDPLTFSRIPYLTVGGSVQLNSATGAFTFTPYAGFSGIASFVFQANDGHENSPPATVSINVAPVADAPRLAATSAVAGQGFKIQRITSDSGQEASFSADGNLISYESRRTVYVKNLITGVVTLASADAAGVQGNASSYEGHLSRDGTKVVFSSAASNLVPNDTNGTALGAADVFVKTIATGAIVRVSTNAARVEGNDSSGGGNFSPDGKKVVFTSNSSNLVAGDTNGTQDIFVKDLATGIIARVTTAASGVEANGSSFGGSFTPDGKKVLFSSTATNLVAGANSGTDQVYLKDLATGAITLLSADSTGKPIGGWFAVLSGDGTKLAFATAAPFDPNDINNTDDIYVKDLKTGAIKLASSSATGMGANDYVNYPTISFDGTVVAFETAATNLVPGTDDNFASDIFVKNMVTGAISRVSTDFAGDQANGYSSRAALTPDGKRIAFDSSASNLTPGDTNILNDLYVVDLPSGKTPVAGGKIDLNIAARVTDGSETITKLTITGYPPGTTFARGNKVGSSWVITDPADIAALTNAPLTMTPPRWYKGKFSLTIAAQSTDTATLTTGSVSDSASTSIALPITIAPAWDPHPHTGLVSAATPSLDLLTPSAGILAGTGV